MHGDGSNPGHDFGRQVGQAILMDREEDPAASQGKYRPTRDVAGTELINNPSQGFHGPAYGTAKAFALKALHKLNKPPFDDTVYEKALRQVRAKGIKPELMGEFPPISKTTAALRKRP